MGTEKRLDAEKRLDTEDRRKPYFFVPANQAISKQYEEGSHDGRLEVTITVITPLHFGSGLLGLDGDVFYHKLYRENGVVILPGSGFKGFLRSVFEAVSESCILTEEDHCKGTTHQCPACAVFGLFGRKSRLSFSSFRYLGDKTENRRLPRLFKPTMPKEKARKFYRHSKRYGELAPIGRSGTLFECIPEGAELKGTISYNNLTKDLLGGLLFALGLGWGETIYYKLGYGKPAYLGSVSLMVKPTTMAQSLFEQDTFTSSQLIELAQAYYDAHKNTINSAVETLKNEWASISETEFSWYSADESSTLVY